MKTFHDGRASLWAGDCLDILDGFESDSFDSIVTDPPYHLLSIVKRFGKTSKGDDTTTSERARAGSDGMARLSRGFMGKEWDGGDIAFRPETWAKVFRVLKPGGHIVAFSAPKCSHRMVCAIEDAGFEIRDGLMWMFGSGFPKSHNLKGDHEGWGTALKPAYEPICLARKPLIGTVAANVLAHGCGAINIDACRVATNETITATRNIALGSSSSGVYGAANVSGIYAQKPEGRWPANIVHDGSKEVVAAFPETGAATASARGGSNPNPMDWGSGRSDAAIIKGHDDAGGSAARFFYSAKADALDRIGSKHPTVKPVDLMRWLCRLVTPKGGVILDLFAGTGTTGEAALREGFRVVMIEREEEYRADITRRMAHVFDGEDGRRYAIAKAKGADAHESLPLFGEAAP